MEQRKPVDYGEGMSGEALWRDFSKSLYDKLVDCVTLSRLNRDIAPAASMEDTRS